MSCRDVHAATVSAFLLALASLCGLLAATLLPEWRVQTLVSFNRNDRNLSVSDGLWTKCVRHQGGRDCAVYDGDWYRALDQPDLRVLQLLLPLALLVALAALLVSLVGMCHTAASPSSPSLGLLPAPRTGTASPRHGPPRLDGCLVNGPGCHLVSATLLLLAAGLTLAPSLWTLLHTAELNRRYQPIWAPGLSVSIALGSAGGMVLSAGLFYLWYCSCRSLPSPFWQPLSSGYPESAVSYPTTLTYASGPYSRRSRLSTIEIDIPVLLTSS